MIGTALTAAFLASTTKSSSSSSVSLILFLVLIAGVGYFLLIRPQKQKARRQQQQQSTIGVGDEIQTVGGIVGNVVDIDSERVTIITGHQTATGSDPTGPQPHRVTLVRNAIARKIEPTMPDPVNLHEDDDEEDETGFDQDDYDQDGYGEHGGPSTGDGRSAEGGGSGP